MARRSRVRAEVEPQETEEPEAETVEEAEGVQEPVQEAPQETADQMESMSVAELNDLISRATAILEGKIGAERQAFIDRIRSEAEGLGLSMQDLMATPKTVKKTPTGREPAAVKYRDGDKTWTGRGRLPTWLTAAEAQGHSRDEFLVK